MQISMSFVIPFVSSRQTRFHVLSCRAEALRLASLAQGPVLRRAQDTSGERGDLSLPYPGLGRDEVILEDNPDLFVGLGNSIRDDALGCLAVSCMLEHVSKFGVQDNQNRWHAVSSSSRKHRVQIVLLTQVAVALSCDAFMEVVVVGLFEAVEAKCFGVSHEHADRWASVFSILDSSVRIQSEGDQVVQPDPDGVNRHCYLPFLCAENLVFPLALPLPASPPKVLRQAVLRQVAFDAMSSYRVTFGYK